MFNQNIEITGITHVDTAVPSAGTYFVSGKIELPRPAAGGAASALITTITNQTGPVTLYTTSAGADCFYVDALCAAGDALRIAFTSANASDRKCIPLFSTNWIGAVR